MKRTLKLKEQLTNTIIYITYGNEEYKKTAKKLKLYELDDLNYSGTANEFIYQDGTGLSCYYVGINDNLEDDVYFLKSTIVHELSHITTMLMKYYNIDDDEFRSLLIGWLYAETMKWIDKILDKS